MTQPVVVKEYDELSKDSRLNSKDIEDLRAFALAASGYDNNGNYRPVLKVSNGELKAQNFVGLLQTKQGTTIEILPKIHVGDDVADVAETKGLFLKMLRVWRRFDNAAFHSSSAIDSLRDFNMLEIFIRMFVENLQGLTQRGLAKHYVSHEDNLPFLKGRILFAQHLRHNLANRARFFVEYDEFSANRPANRLIHSTLALLLAQGQAREFRNRQQLQELLFYFSDIPRSSNKHADKQKYQIDRSMTHYQPVMQWVLLFLFNEGLTTFKGDNLNQCLLFPMEQIFEDYVAHCFRRHAPEWDVVTQRTDKHLAYDIDNKPVFGLCPDIRIDERGNTIAIADTKWKHLNDGKPSQSDLYQLYAYGKKYECKELFLVYPKSENFPAPIRYEYEKDMHLCCYPFDIKNPENSIAAIMKEAKRDRA